jgi:acyl dehydratase
MRTIEDLSALQALAGQDVAVGDWVEITQARIDAFAEATGDRQWIHVDEARARVESPYGATIAHGFLTLSLASQMMRDAVAIGSVRMAINYGLNRVRFVAPVPSGSRIRPRIALATAEPTPDGVQAVWRIEIEREGSDKPAAAIEWVVRYYPEPGRAVRPDEARAGEPGSTPTRM